MIQREAFLNILNTELKHYNKERRYVDTATNFSNNLITEKDGFDFDLEATFSEWAKSADIDYVIVDVANAIQADIDNIKDHWNKPTAYLFQNYGSKSAGELRNVISTFIKDRSLGEYTPHNTDPLVILTITTVLKAAPDIDYHNERLAFFSHHKF